MNYEIKTPLFKPSMVFKEEELVVGKKIYPYSEITNLRIMTQPDGFSNGMLQCFVNGKKMEWVYSSKSKTDMEKVMKKISSKIQSKVHIWTAEELFDIAEKKKYLDTVSRKKGIRNFEVIADEIESQEEVLFAFTGRYKKMNTEDTKRPKGHVSFVVTGNRIIAGQAKDHFIDCISLNEIKEITFREVDLLGIIVLKLEVGVISITVDNHAVKELYIELYGLMKKEL